jgi:hypothetical protein
MVINTGLHERWRVAKHFLQIHVNVLYIYLPEWLNVVVFPLFGHRPFWLRLKSYFERDWKRCVFNRFSCTAVRRALANRAPSLSPCPEPPFSPRLSPHRQTTSSTCSFLHWRKSTTRCNRKRLPFALRGITNFEFETSSVNNSLCHLYITITHM